MTDFTPDDIVPTFRSDLELTATGQGAGENVITVIHPQSGARLELRGFELSIARMLNGTRSAAEVVVMATAIGLPLTLEALTAFVAHLRAQGFVNDPGGDAAEGGRTWPQRQVWDEVHRAQFQKALREARTNLLSEAKQHLEELQADAFDNVDVKELHDWVESRLQEESPTQKAMPTFAELYNSVEQSWFDQGDKESDASAKAPVAPKTARDVIGDEPAVRRSRRWPWVLLALISIAAVAVAVVPWPARVKGTFVLEPHATVDVAIEIPGVVGVVDVKDGQWVVPGEVLFHYDTDTPKKKLAEIEARQASLQQQLEQLTQAVAIPVQELEQARAPLTQAQAELEAAQAAKNADEIARAKRHIRKAQPDIDAAEAALAKARADAETTAGVTEDALKAQLAAAAAEHGTQKALSELPPLKAQAKGTVYEIALKQGETVQPGTRFCRVDNTASLVVRIHTDATELHPGQAAEATIDGQSVRLSIDKVDGGEGRALIENPDRTFKPGTRGELSIPVEARTLLARWL